MEGNKREDYKKKVCVICKNNANCDKESIYVHNTTTNVSIRCPHYKYVNYDD